MRLQQKIVFNHFKLFPSDKKTYLRCRELFGCDSKDRKDCGEMFVADFFKHFVLTQV